MKSLMKIRLRLLVATLFALAALMVVAPASAETLVLKTGERVTGRIISQDRERVVIRTAQGPQVVFKRDISRLIYGGAQDDEAAKNAEEERKAAEAARLAREREAERRRQAELQRRQAAEARAAREQFQREQDLYAAAVTRLEEKRREQEAAERRETEEEREAAEQEKQREQELADKGAGDPWGALWRSAVLPGWGHYYSGQTWWGVGYATAFAAAGGYVYHTRQLAFDAKVRYQNYADTTFVLSLIQGPQAIDQFAVEVQSRSDLYGSRVADVSRATAVLGGVYLIQMLHAVLINLDGGLFADGEVPGPADPEKGLFIGGGLRGAGLSPYLAPGSDADLAAPLRRPEHSDALEPEPVFEMRWSARF